MLAVLTSHQYMRFNSIQLFQGATVYIKQEHSCSSSLEDNIIVKSVHECRKKVSEGIFPAVPSEFNKTVASLSDAGINMIKKIPRLSNVRTSFYRTRNKSAGIEKLRCKSVEEVTLPSKFNQFLMADYNEFDTRILIFATEEAKFIETQKIERLIIVMAHLKVALSHFYNSILYKGRYNVQTEWII